MENNIEIGNIENNELELYYANGGNFIGYLKISEIIKKTEVCE